MVDNHYEVDETVKPARDLMDCLRNLQNSWNQFVNVRDRLIQQKDTDAQDNTAYAQIATRYGYSGADTAAQQAAAAASFAELDSCYGAANAAIVQMLARHL